MDNWKKINKSDNNLFTTSTLDNNKGYIVYTDLDDKEQTKKFVDTTIQIFGNYYTFEKQSFENT